MRNFTLIFVVAFLAGCSSVSSLEDGAPQLSANSAKSPRAYAKCLNPKWQEINASTTSTETENGYRLLLNLDFVGAAVMAEIAQSKTGSNVKVYKSSAIMGSGRWVETARSCL